MLFEALVRPCTIKYERYEFAALGRLAASIVGIEAGLFAACEMTAAAPEANVFIRNTCRTWKTKYHLRTLSSTEVLVGSPNALKIAATNQKSFLRQWYELTPENVRNK